MSQQVSVRTQRQDGSTQVGAMRSSKGLFVKTTDLTPQWTASWNSDVYQHLYHTEHALTAWCIGISVRVCMNVYGSRWFSDGRLCLCERLCEQMIIVNAYKQLKYTFLNCFNCFFALCCKSEWLITFWGNDSLTLYVLILKTVNLDGII